VAKSESDFAKDLQLWLNDSILRRLRQCPVNCSLRPTTYELPYELPIVPSYNNKLSALPFMSHTHPTASSSSNQASNFQLILINALDAYKKRTKKDLLAHPLVTELQSCNSPSAILAVLQQQLQGLGQSRRSDERWTRWLDPTVNVLYTLSGTLGEGVGLARIRS
jgi:hypothetical protein